MRKLKKAKKHKAGGGDEGETSHDLDEDSDDDANDEMEHNDAEEEDEINEDTETHAIEESATKTREFEENIWTKGLLYIL